MPALATWAPEDGVLGAVAPLALAIAQPTALVVDLDESGPAYPSSRTLRSLVVDGPRPEDLAPSRPGVAVLANGGIAAEEAAEILALLLSAWPAVVIRLPAQSAGDVPAPLVGVRLLLPGGLFSPEERGVYQPVGPAPRPKRPGSGRVVLPVAPRRALSALLRGERPAPSRWLRAWSPVWGASW